MPSIREPSICIPRVSSNITKSYIKNIFEQIFGNNSIERIDLVKKTYSNNKIYHTAFIHFNYWNDSSNVQAIRNRIMNNQSFKIVYSEPWFWKCSISKAIKPLIYTQYNDRRIVKRYENTNIVTDPYSEFFEEINNNWIEDIYLTPPPLTRQPAMGYRSTTTYTPISN
jgi:2-hydroxy-3-keto-5-methylthiopentenyl-1-phosphate phosphatase